MRSLRSSLPPAGPAMVPGSVYREELEFEMSYGAHTLRELCGEAAQAQVTAILEQVRREQTQEYLHAIKILPRLSSVVEILSLIPRVILDSTANANCHLVVLRVDLPTRAPYRFVRSVNMSETLNENTDLMAVFQQVGHALLMGLMQHVPATYMSIEGNGYSRITKFRDIELTSEIRAYGSPRWAAVIPLIYETYANCCITLRHPDGGEPEFCDMSRAAGPTAQKGGALFGADEDWPNHPYASLPEAESVGTWLDYPDDADGSRRPAARYQPDPPVSYRQRSLSYNIAGVPASDRHLRRLSMLPKDAPAAGRRRSSLVGGTML